MKTIPTSEIISKDIGHYYSPTAYAYKNLSSNAVCIILIGLCDRDYISLRIGFEDSINNYLGIKNEQL